MDNLPVRVVNVDSRTRVGTAGDASNFQVELQEPIKMPKGSVCWVTEMQLPVVWRNIEPTLNGRLYIQEIDNRAVARLPDLDAVVFTDHNGSAVTCQADGGPFRWNLSGSGIIFLPALNGVSFTSGTVTVHLAVTADPRSTTSPGQ